MNPDGSQDNNAVSLYDTDSNKVLTYDEIDGSGGTAALKITSKCKVLSVVVGHLIGGSENCLDLNNECEAITVRCDNYEVRGKYAISAKTCSRCMFLGHITGKPSKWHFNLGSWSDQSSKTLTGTHLAVTADAYPILVWVGNSELPTFDDPLKYKVIGFGRYGAVVRGLVMFFWGVAKKLGFKI
jgi:hypothetical protein